MEWYNTLVTCGQGAVKCWPLSQTLLESAEKQKPPEKNKVKKKPWYWDLIHQIEFASVKTTIVKEVVLAYLDYKAI